MSDETRPEFELGRDGSKWIVVGVDGSTSSERAGAYAAGLARRQGSRVAVVFAREPAAAPIPGTEGGVSITVETQDRIEEHLRDLAERRVWPVEAQIFVRQGSPYRVITEIAGELATGLIVLGSSHQRAYLRPGGPLPVKIMRLRTWPVLVVP